MKKQNLLQMLLFSIFFLIGTLAVSISVLSNEIVEYYQNKNEIITALENTKKLKSLNADYEALISNIGKDPNFAKRIAPAELNIQNSDANIAFPKADSTDIKGVKSLLAEDAPQKLVKPQIPRWLVRCDLFSNRIALFAAGTYLIIISFIFFGRSRPQEK